MKAGDQAALDARGHVPIPARLPKGFELGRYIVDGWLRDGGMAAIYRAHRVDDQRRVAMKLQLPFVAHGPLTRTRFEREVELLKRASGSPHIVELLDAGALGDGRRYLVMEWVEGEDLEELLDSIRNRERHMALPRACRIAHGVAAGLVELHHLSVAHLDVKPANVMIGGDEGGEGLVKLVDLGASADLRQLHICESSVVIGTSSYMSPQQARGEPPELGFDIYAMGVLMYEMLSGSCVPPSGCAPEKLPRIETRRREIPRSLANLVHGCMSSDPTRRPRTANEVATALATALGEIEASETRQEPRAVEALVRSGGTERISLASVPSFLCGHAETDAECKKPRQKVARVVLESVAVLGCLAAWMGDVGGAASSVERTTAQGGASTHVAQAASGGQSKEEALVEPQARGEVVSTQEPLISRQPSPRLEQPAVVSVSQKPTRGPLVARRNTEACVAARVQAEAARKTRGWHEVLRATSKRICWPSREQRLERRRLRVTAYAELRSYEKCVKEAEGSTDEDVEARAGFCEKKLGDDP